MQLDRTRIAIRERGLWEIMDLALRTTYLYARPLLWYSALLILPLAAFNWSMTHRIVAEEYSSETNVRYIWLMTQLVFLQAPLATLAATMYLGRVMFLDEVRPRSLLTDLVGFTPRILWCQLIVRAGLGAFIAAFNISTDATASPAEVALPVLCIYAIVLRSSRPFINEIILLEKNPLRSTKRQTMTIRRRSSSLHSPSAGELVIYWIVLAAACVGLAVSLSLAFWFLAGAITSQWNWRTTMVEVLVPLAMWLVVIYATVARFLMYLDLRIRREGWEVELKVRAAANELRGQTA